MFSDKNIEDILRSLIFFLMDQYDDTSIVIQYLVKIKICYLKKASIISSTTSSQ